MKSDTAVPQHIKTLIIYFSDESSKELWAEAKSLILHLPGCTFVAFSTPSLSF